MYAVLTYLRTHRTLSSILAILVIAAVGTAGYIAYRSAAPVDLKHTDLSKASPATVDKAAAQLSTSVDGLPDFLSEDAKSQTQNLLGNILRQKYGVSSQDLKGIVREDIGYDSANDYQFLIDVQAKNETYLATVTNGNGFVTIICAPQGQQMDPSTSNCTTLPGVDNNAFPNG